MGNNGNSDRFYFLGLQNHIEVSFVIYFRKIDLLYDVEMYYGGSSHMLLHSDSQSPLEGQQKSSGVSTKCVSERLNYWENLAVVCKVILGSFRML